MSEFVGHGIGVLVAPESLPDGERVADAPSAHLLRSVRAGAVSEVVRERGRPAARGPTTATSTMSRKPAFEVGIGERESVRRFSS